ncbi:MAG: putative Ig domain-containing protein [Aquabacterium sp.]
MTERIEVGYTPAAFVGGLGISHKYILYTNSNGGQFYARGGPGYFGPGASDGGRDEASSSPFGNIKTKSGEYDRNSPDWDKARDPLNPDSSATPHPRETIKTGDDLSREWNKIKEAVKRVDDKNIPYDPRSSNSNSTVDEALREAGLPAPQNDGPSDNWAPGSDFDLPGGDVPGNSNEKKFWEDFEKWFDGKTGWEDFKKQLEKDVLDTLLDWSKNLSDLGKNIKSWWDRAKNWVWPRDPIILDLDGNGLETVGLAANIYFDHDGDGVLNKTGWVGKNDALLVWDRNANGSIDTGAELFGDFTVLPNGTLAPNGFAALAALDANGDGIIDATDPAFAELKIWRDSSQDGLSGAGELISLSDAGIISLNLANALKNQRLPNGNTLSREGSFTRVDGTSASMGEFHLATDTFSTRFAETIDVPDSLKSLPTMGGAGNVRELRQAAAQSGALASVLADFQAASTRAEQKALLEQLLGSWANTSGMARSLGERAAGRYNIEYEAFGSERRSANVLTGAFIVGGIVGDPAVAAGAGMFTDYDGKLISAKYRKLIDEWTQKIHVLESFNGQYFFNLPEVKSQTAGANWGLSITASTGYASGSAASAVASRPTIRINFSQGQLDLLQRAYDSLVESVYASLVMQTRLKPYLDSVELVIDENGLKLDARALNERLAEKRSVDPENYLADLLDLDRYAGSFLAGTNWVGLTDFDSVVESMPKTANVLALLDEFKVRTLTDGDDVAGLTSADDIALAGAGNDVMYGQDGADRLYGQAGDDRLYGGNGKDLLSGGAGADLLAGEAGADTYIFGRGDGNDTITDYAEFGQQTDTVRFLGLKRSDLEVIADHRDNLLFRIIDTGETLTVPRDGYWWGKNGVGRYVFDDGTIWTHDDALRATVQASTENDDIIYGSSVSDVITGQAGNDALVGRAGDDIIDGGAGNDLLIGNTSWRVVWDNGAVRYERSLDSVAGPNGNDTYLFGRGDGQDTLIDGDYTDGNIDVLRFKDGVTVEDVQLSRQGSDLTLSIRNTPDQITIKKYFEPSSARNSDWGSYLIEKIAFQDGTTLQLEDVQAILFAGSNESEVIVGSNGANTLTGQAGDDVLLGGAGQDILDGGSGDDILHGGGVLDEWNRIVDISGADTYRFGRGDGHDTIIEESWQPADVDRIQLKDGVEPSDLTLRRIRRVNGWQISDDLQITIRDTGETITVKGHFNPGQRNAVELIEFTNGTSWGLDEIKSRTLIGESGNDELTGFSDRDDLIVGAGGNDRLVGLRGNDVLIGGAGDDVLEGGAGSDTYKFGLGDGKDVIDESMASGEDTLELAEGISPSDVLVRWTLQQNMALTLPDGSTVTVLGQAFTWSTETGVERVKFFDGTVWDRAELARRALSATDGDDAIVGGGANDSLDGGAGNDTFQDIGGYDTYRFGVGSGQDTITDESGQIQFKPGVGQNDVAFTRDGRDLIATIKGSGDSLRLKGWITNWSRISRFSFENGAQLSSYDIEALLNVGADSEILYGSPEGDELIGTDKSSTLYGREGNDTLSGGGGRDNLLGEQGDDTLDGGADRDYLYGGTGSNRYVVTRGSGLDTAYAESTASANDTVVFGPGIRPEDVSIQLGDTSWTSEPGDLGYTSLVIGIGGNDALIVRANDGEDIGRSAIRSFKFEDGTEWTLNDVVAKADVGSKMGDQSRYFGDPTTIIGSQADDFINDYTGDSVSVSGRGNDDTIRVGSGDDKVSGGSGDDEIFTGSGDDLISGEGGADHVRSESGDDVLLFNFGDGHDTWRPGSNKDTLSFGADITSDMISVSLNEQGMIVLHVQGGAGGSISIDSSSEELPGDLERLQFIAADGSTRTFDFSGWLLANKATLLANSNGSVIAFDGGSHELTGTVAPVGGTEAIAYAQVGDLFATPSLSSNTPSPGDDVIYGTSGVDVLNAGDGNDIILGSAGDDVLDGGEGDDLIFGGSGDDTLTGGPGADELYGEWGGDTYVYEIGHGEVIIDDDHKSLSRAPSSEFEWGYGEEVIDTAPNVLSFGAGIRREDLRFSELDGDLLIEFSNRPGDRVVLRGYEPGRATQTRSVDIIRFADGEEIVSQTIDVSGRTAFAGDDGGWLGGTSRSDTLIGGEGDDTFNGEGGADKLVGGAGSDTYYIHKEWGSAATETLIAETWRAQDSNRIELTGDIQPDSLRLEFDGQDLLLRLTEGGDAIRFAGFDPRVAEMQSPVQTIDLPWMGVSLSFEDLLAKGLRIVGTPENDVLTGTALSDWIEGKGADDTLIGAEGGDLYFIEADGGTDTILDSEVGGSPNVLVLPDGVTPQDLYLSYDQEGFLIIDIESTGNRVRLSGFDPADPLGARAVERIRFGVNGQEMSYDELLSNGFDISGGDDSDELNGTALTDRYWGGSGNDLIDATVGGDWLHGEAGNDTYVVNVGDGVVTIEDVAEQDAGNVLRFGPGIDPEELRNNLRFEADGNGGSWLLIPYGEEGDVVRITGFDPQNVYANVAIERFEFADGTSVDFTTLVSWTFVVEGDSADNSLDGTNVGDRLYGYDGDDLLSSGDGEDVLTGGLGADVLAGGGQRDAYVVNIGDGIDSIEDTVENSVGNILSFGEGISRDDVRVEIDGSDLIVAYGANGDSVRVVNFAPDGLTGATVIDTFEFADGTDVTLKEFMNRAPTIGNAIEDQVIQEDGAFSLRLPDNLFVDPDGDDILTRVTLTGYEKVPDWLQYDPATRTLFGTPTNENVGEFDVIVQGIDELGASSLYSFHVAVENTNDAPINGTTIQDVTASEDASFEYAVPLDAFRDADLGDSLTYSASLAGGEPLPAWISFDPVSRRFTGIPDNSDVGAVLVKVIATDRSGASASQTFELTIANTNDAPVIAAPLSSQEAQEDQAFIFRVPLDAFADADVGDELSLSATLEGGQPLPSWLQFDAATKTLFGTPGSGDVGEFKVRIAATDKAGSSVDQLLALKVSDVNDAPVVNALLLAQRAVEDTGFTYTFSEDSFVDADVTDVLTYSASSESGEPLPSWLQFDPSTRTFFGTPTNADVGLLRVKVVATDSVGATAFQAFELVVGNTNDAPTAMAPIGAQVATEDAVFTFVIPHDAFVDADVGDRLSYVATLKDGSPLPTWLKFDPFTGTFSGIPANADVGVLQVVVTATDLSGASATQDFDLSISNTNDSPESLGSVADLLVNEDTAFSYALPLNELFRDVDVGDSLSVFATLADGSPLPSWISFDATRGVFSGKALNSDVGAIQVRLVARDSAGQTISHLFKVDVANTNDAPIVRGTVPSQTATEDAQFLYVIPSDVLVDEDAGDTLSLVATTADGAPLPSWLIFDPVARTLSGQPLNSDVGTLSIKVEATDKAGAKASQIFSVSVTNVNDAPEVGIALVDQVAKAGIQTTWIMPDSAFRDIDFGDQLTYTASLADGSALPGWLGFDPTSRTFSGTPSASGEYAIRVIATDGAGASASQVFNVRVEGSASSGAPITSSDSANLIEDRKILTCGNVLSNDRDPQGDRLRVTNGGFKTGEFGTLILESDGDYAYAINNWASKVQALGAGESVVDRFTYVASDGSNSAPGELTFTIQGVNDAPELAKCLVDVQLARGKEFSWKVPTGSFRDMDRNDSLTYSATLSNGKPLPTWLKFDPATQSFSGTAPANAKTKIDVRVVATDGRGESSFASDVFSISFGNRTIVPTDTSVEDVRESSDHGGGVGRGLNVLDALGSALAHSGKKSSSSGDDDVLSRFLDGFKRESKSGSSLFDKLDRRWFEQAGEQRDDASAGRSSQDVERHWAELTNALNRLDAERQGTSTWNNPNQGADISRLVGWLQGGSAISRSGVDSVSLACSTGTDLKGFTGIQEGVGKLPW